MATDYQNYSPAPNCTTTKEHLDGFPEAGGNRVTVPAIQDDAQGCQLPALAGE